MGNTSNINYNKIINLLEHIEIIDFVNKHWFTIINFRFRFQLIKQTKNNQNYQ